MELNILNVKEILNKALKTGGDFAEIFVEDKKSFSLHISNKQVEGCQHSRIGGVGIRIRKNTSEIYGFCASYDPKELLKLAAKLSSNFKGEQTKFVRDMTFVPTKELDSSIIPHSKWSIQEKLDYLRKGEKAIYEYSNEIVNASCSLSESDQDITIYNSNGKYYKDTRVRTRVGFVALASFENTFESGAELPGIFGGLELLEQNNPEELGKKAATTAVNLVHAPLCPSGEMPVIIGNAFGGVLFHEACGHPLEANATARGLSVFANKLGKQIASPLVNAFDDGTIANGYGTLNIDDEGNPTTKNQLIKDGICTNFMIDELTSTMLKQKNPLSDPERYKVTGCSRRESYRYAPTTRMTNTYIDNGTSTKEEIIQNTKKGIYCVSFTGGQVDPSTCKFNFSASEAYLIEDGKITTLVRGAGIIGYGHEVLMNIDMIANDLEIRAGMCGASSGSCPVTVGQPTLRVSKLTVSGSGN